MKLSWDHSVVPKRIPPDETWTASISAPPYVYTVRAESITGRAGDTWYASTTGWHSGGHATAEEARAAAQKHWDEFQTKTR